MTIDELLDYFGNRQVNIARAMGVTKATINKWYKNKQIPEIRQYQIELLTKGKLKADIDVNINHNKQIEINRLRARLKELEQCS